MAKKPAARRGASKPANDHERAKARHAKALHAHADALNAATAVTNALSRAQILDRLARRWAEDPKDVKLDDPLSNYIVGGPGAIAAYYIVLNSMFPGLHLTDRDLAGVTKVKHMVEVVFRGLQGK
jgi:hypothetical protein